MLISKIQSLSGWFLNGSLSTVLHFLHNELSTLKEYLYFEQQVHPSLVNTAMEELHFSGEKCEQDSGVGSKGSPRPPGQWEPFSCIIDFETMRTTL